MTHEFNGYNIKQLREYLTARKVNFTESEDRNALIIKVFEYRQSIGQGIVTGKQIGRAHV